MTQPHSTNTLDLKVVYDLSLYINFIFGHSLQEGAYNNKTVVNQKFDIRVLCHEMGLTNDRSKCIY